MNRLLYLLLSIRLRLAARRAELAKAHMLSLIQNSRRAAHSTQRYYQRFLFLSARQEALAVALKRIVESKSEKPIIKARLFPGKVTVTQKARLQLTIFDMEMALTHHRNGDWGELPAAEWRRNNMQALSGSGAVRSKYPCRSGGFFLIDTDLPAGETTIQLEAEAA